MNRVKWFALFALLAGLSALIFFNLPQPPGLVPWRAIKVSGHLRSMAISPDNKFLATCLDGSTIVTLWEIDQRKPVWRYDNRTGLKKSFVPNLAFSEDGKTLIVAGGHITFLEITSGKVTQTFKPAMPDHFAAFALSPNGNYLAASTNANFRIWRVKDGKLIHTKRYRESFSMLLFSPDSQSLTASDHKTKIWSIPDLKLKHEIPLTGYSAKFSEDGKQLFFYTYPESIRWDIATNKQIDTFVHDPHLEHAPIILGQNGLVVYMKQKRQNWLSENAANLFNQRTYPTFLKYYLINNKTKLAEISYQTPPMKGGLYYLHYKQIVLSPDQTLLASEIEAENTINLYKLK